MLPSTTEKSQCQIGIRAVRIIASHNNLSRNFCTRPTLRLSGFIRAAGGKQGGIPRSGTTAKCRSANRHFPDRGRLRVLHGLIQRSLINRRHTPRVSGRNQTQYTQDRGVVKCSGSICLPLNLASARSVKNLTGPKTTAARDHHDTRSCLISLGVGRSLALNLLGSIRRGSDSQDLAFEVLNHAEPFSQDDGKRVGSTNDCTGRQHKHNPTIRQQCYRCRPQCNT